MQIQKEGWVPCDSCEIPASCESVWTSALNSDTARIYTLVTCTMENIMQIGAFRCQTQGSRSHVKEVKVPSLLEAYRRNVSTRNPQQWGHDLVQLGIFTGGAVCLGLFASFQIDLKE